MAKYDKDTKFYWLQLKEDFFEDDAIEWLEEQKPNGRDYAYFYLKLCLKSLKSNGVLIRKVGNILIPYDNNKLAELTKMDFDTVTVAMELLKKIGLVQILENGEIYINQLENLIGSKSMGAFKKQQQRLLSGQKVDICPPKIEIELDIEKDIDIKKENKKKKVEHYGEYKNVFFTEEQYEKLLKDFPNDYKTRIQRLDDYMQSTGKKYKDCLATIRNWARKEGYKFPQLEDKQKTEYKAYEGIENLTDEEYWQLQDGKITVQELIEKGKLYYV